MKSVAKFKQKSRSWLKDHDLTFIYKRMAFPTLLATLVHERPHMPSLSKNIYSVNRIDIKVDAQTSFLFQPHPLFGFVDVYRSDKDVDKFRNSPDMKNWNQLNFAVWCATAGCGIGLDLLSSKENREMKFIASLLRFHVYYTTRRVLHEMGAALPDEVDFDPKNNSYSSISHSHLVSEFHPLDEDFRFKGGENQGLGTIHLWFPGHGEFEAKSMVYGQKTSFAPPSFNNAHIYYIKLPDLLAKNQAMYFIPSTSKGLTPPGVVRINQSLEALCYCVLAAQTSVRHSIDGIVGLEAQKQFLKLVEDVIGIADASVLISKFQKSLENTRRRLDFAVSPFLRLVPSNLIVNVEDLDVPGYNNMIKEEDGPGVHFGFNNTINPHKIVPTGRPPVRSSNQVALQREEARNMLITGGFIIVTIVLLRKLLQ